MSTWSDLKNNPRLKRIYEQRIAIIKLIHEFFWSRGFVETETPIAVRWPGQEPYLNPVPVKFHDPTGAERQFHLQTSPEFAMKKLLAAGWGKIFQICKCFRDYESFGDLHNPEFTMLEWYRAPGTLEEIMDDTEKMFKFISVSFDKSPLACPAPNGAGEGGGGVLAASSSRQEGARGSCRSGEVLTGVDIMGCWDQISMREVWQRYVGVNLDDYLEAEKMRGLAERRGYPAGPDNAYEDLFYKIFLNEIEPKLGLERPIFIYDYPARMCSLSRLCVDPRYAERFELYIGGLELANAFGELLDAEEQGKRLEEDKKKRAALGKETWPVDPDFIAALRSGIPPAGGIALGVDRMVLLFTGARDLNEVIFTF